MLDQVRQSIHAMQIPLEDEIIIVAVSGGADSLVLLHCLHALQDEFGYALHVATFDHQLRGETSAADADFVRLTAEQMRLPVSVGGSPVGQLATDHQENVELMARQARYTFLVDVAAAQEASYIAVGHHRDDQVETMLMHLIRGTGLFGLRGMAPLSPLSPLHLRDDAAPELFTAIDEYDIHIVRPLLACSRDQIEAYTADTKLTPRYDDTNADTRYLRNKLRHRLIPQLAYLNPQIHDGLARLATIIQGDYDIIEDAVITAIGQLVEWGETDAGEIAYVERSEFLRLSVGLQRQVLRRIVQDLSTEDVGFDHIESMRDLIKTGRTGQQLDLPDALKLSIGYDDFMLHYGGEIPFPVNLPRMAPRQVLPLEIDESILVVEHMRLYNYVVLEHHSQELYRADPLESTLAIPENAELTLRTRRQGDRFRPMGMDGHSQKLTDTFSNLKIPQMFRDRIPLLLVNDEIAWFVAPTAQGIQGRVAEPYAVKSDSPHVVRFRWELLR